MLSLPERRRSPFRALAVALVLILASALVPLSRGGVQRSDADKPKSASELITRQLPPGEAEAYMSGRVRQQLEELRAMGYITHEPTVFVTGHNVPKPSTWLDRLLGRVHADTFYTGDGVAVLTLIDGGDPNTAEWAIDVYSWRTGTEVWGVQAMNAAMPGYAWSWGEGMSSPGMARVDGNVLENLCSAMSPTVLAAPYFCRDTWQAARSVLNRAFGAAVGGSGGAIFWCVGASLGYGGCLAGNFFGTFAGTLIYESVYMGGVCREWW